MYVVYYIGYISYHRTWKSAWFYHPKITQNQDYKYFYEYTSLHNLFMYHKTTPNLRPGMCHLGGVSDYVWGLGSIMTATATATAFAMPVGPSSTQPNGWAGLFPENDETAPLYMCRPFGSGAPVWALPSRVLTYLVAQTSHLPAAGASAVQAAWLAITSICLWATIHLVLRSSSFLVTCAFWISAPSPPCMSGQDSSALTPSAGSTCAVFRRLVPFSMKQHIFQTTGGRRAVEPAIKGMPVRT